MTTTKKHVGIFGTWDVSFWAKPGDILQAKLEKNPLHPFTETELHRYEVTIRSPWLWINILLTVIVLLGCIIYYSINEPDQMLAFGIIALVVTLYSVYVYYDIRKIVIDMSKHEYSFYKADHLVYRGHVHNVYIRLVGQKSGTGEVYYKVVLNGYHLEEQALTSSTVRKDKLEKLARKLATRLNINYFDWMDKSTKHVIRHRCPYASKPGSPSSSCYDV
ncbi:cation channel sperm-associated auxiliary subunit TMEM249-like [Amphiura filiformis]|uniref:cation channel sperm-associated auxiliary subunit TMEM249-like n=1 Tax=Amphiura filiformis TaxID=82378 RepID=UPI003B21413C